MYFSNTSQSQGVPLVATSPPFSPCVCMCVVPSSQQWWLHLHLSLRRHGLTFNHSSQLFLFLTGGDFNHHHSNWLGVGTSLASHGTPAKDFCDSIGLTRSVNFSTRISPNGKSPLPDLVITNIPTNVSWSFSAPVGSSDHVLWNPESYLCAGESGSSLRQTDRDCKQPSYFRSHGLLYPLPLILIQPGNSSTETFFLLWTDSSHLVFSNLTHSPALSTLNPVLRLLL